MSGRREAGFGITLNNNTLLVAGYCWNVLTKKCGCGRRLEFNWMGPGIIGFGALFLIEKEGLAPRLRGYGLKMRHWRVFYTTCSNPSLEFPAKAKIPDKSGVFASEYRWERFLWVTYSIHRSASLSDSKLPIMGNHSSTIEKASHLRP